MSGSSLLAPTLFTAVMATHDMRKRLLHFLFSISSIMKLFGRVAFIFHKSFLMKERDGKDVFSREIPFHLK